MVDERISKALDRAVELGEVGIQVAAYVGDELVVDAWTGAVDKEGTRAVDGDTLFPTQSVTKGFTVTCLHIQADRGLVDYEAPVCTYWPEFAANGKENVTVRHVLSHRSGVPAPADTTQELSGDWEWMTNAIAGTELLYPPGEKGAYQTLTFGYIVGEIVRRTDPQARLPRDFIREEICEPLGIEDFYLGLSPELHARVATNYRPEEARAPQRLTQSAVPPLYVKDPADPYPYRFPNPSGGAVMNARAGARFFAMLANAGTLDGVRIVSAERVAQFSTPRPVKYEYDEVIGFVAVLSNMGFWLADDSPEGFAVIGSDPGVFSSPGAGGTTAWADPSLKLGALICHNRMFSSYPPPEGDLHPFNALGDALRDIAAEC